jgi:Mlc titration factor MtfA (ptsG expression regulator)
MFRFLRKRRRAKIRAREFPPEWRAHIERNVPYYALLDPSEKAEVEGSIQVFLAEKRFEGMEGLEITDEVRVTIAAQAVILLLGRETDCYPDLDTIIVYPRSYVAKVLRRLPDGSTREVLERRLGESWQTGQMVLSWDDVKRGAADIHDGHNVVMHEFAHQLDGESGATRGDPVLEERSMYVAWARVLGESYERLHRELERHRRSCIDSYGATSPAEFFAVVTETFFERPERLERCYPELYEQMRLYYKQDPAARYENARGGKR